MDDCTTRAVTVDLNFDEKTHDEAALVPFFENVWQRKAWRPSGSTARTQPIAKHACCQPVIPAPRKNSAGGIPVFSRGKSNWRATVSKNSTAQRAGRLQTRHCANMQGAETLSAARCEAWTRDHQRTFHRSAGDGESAVASRPKRHETRCRHYVHVHPAAVTARRRHRIGRHGKQSASSS